MQYWLKDQKGKQALADFFKVQEMPEEDKNGGKVALTNIFLVGKP